ncbi:hypothetical protein RFI_06703 [Reticulomyxa filosa]|uniref:Uncharacterized protein n=1 Tax=Reticulomyxa filosa TaxID=46433 RepID=X6NX74_RETFI|nr:hypothetical protein RFI_06703 [Reticulomyxa filosa]|eukprot:ETO30419.1 hypothetical protein RFI_06703 [Reticulomyxa filosa]
MLKKAAERSHARGRAKSPLPSNRSQSIPVKNKGTGAANEQKPIKPDARSVSATKRDTPNKLTIGLSTVTGNVDMSFEIPKDATPKQTIDFITSCLNTITTLPKARADLLDKYKHLIAEDEKMSPDDVKYAIDQFKISMQAQVLGEGKGYIYMICILLSEL